MADIIYVSDLDEIKRLLKENNTQRKRKAKRIVFKCPKCGKETSSILNNFSHKDEFLCPVCSRKKTNLKIYGVEHALQSEQTKEKARGNPLQYSCLENRHGQRSLAGYMGSQRVRHDQVTNNNNW